MKRPISFKAVTLLGVVALAVSGLLALSMACSNQGEGDRCEILNDNEDCSSADGLVCTAAASLNNSISDRCCPADRSHAKEAVCKTPINVSGDASAPSDTGPSPDASTDSGGETGPSDAARDAAADG